MATSTPVVVQTQTTTLSGDLFLGSGPRTVFLHAGVTDRRSWERVVGKLIPQLTAVTYDRRGFGESLVSPNAFSHVEDLLAVIEETGEGPVWLVGSSAGGGVAIDTALSSPEHVVGLVLIAPAVNGSPELELDPATARFEQSLDDAVAKGDAAELNRLEAWLWLDGPKEPEGRVHGPARSLFLEMNEAIIRNEVPEEAGESALDAWSQLGRLHLPVTVACGDLDVPFFVQRSRELADRLPTARYVELRGVAHLPQLENPAVVAGLVEQAIRTS